jgi:hypothetical protein
MKPLKLLKGSLISLSKFSKLGKKLPSFFLRIKAYQKLLKLMLFQLILASIMMDLFLSCCPILKV